MGRDESPAEGVVVVLVHGSVLCFGPEQFAAAVDRSTTFPEGTITVLTDSLMTHTAVLDFNMSDGDGGTWIST